MSSVPNLHNENLTTDAPPEHHVHKASEPLPGARGGAPTADYSASTMERLPSSVWQEADPAQPTRELDASAPQTRPELPERSNSATGRTAFSAERPVNTEPHGGGVAVDGAHEDMPTGKVSASDKLIGKAQQVVGKMAHKPALHEKGELREAGGKSAVTDDA
ncbi:hypothetical protein DFH06DRAFT_1197299 [Mycena polygramma]|nr:hypothetical protein DFH06DRAFT_1197299 [Mycena polygramma]